MKIRVLFLLPVTHNLIVNIQTLFTYVPQGYGQQQQFDIPQQPTQTSFSAFNQGTPNVGPNFNTPHQGPQPPQYQNAFPMAANLGVLGQPVVQDMAMQYGQQVCK